MLQRVLASLLCLLGAAAIGLGIASASLWRSSDTLVAVGSAAPGTTLLMTEPGVLDLAADEVTVTASAESGDQVVIALGRTADVEAWIGGDAHTRVTGLATWDTLATQDVPAVEPPASEAPAEPAPAEPAPAEGEQPAAEPAAEEPADAAVAPDPTGSDLWIDEVSGADQATMEWTRQDGRWSILVATTGEGAGAATLTMTWPQIVTTPYLVPAVAGGSALLLVGLIWWTLLLVRRRRPARAATVPRARPAADRTPEPMEEILDVAGTAPLTRRAIRELEEQEMRRHQRERTRSAFPARVTDPRPDDAGTQPPVDLRGRTPDAAPPSTAGSAPERMTAAAERETSDRSDQADQADRAGQADQAGQQASLSEAAGSGESAGGRARRESAVRWGRRPILPARLRRPARADPGAAATGAVPSGLPGPADPGPRADSPTASAATGASGTWSSTISGPTAAHQASVSADAWRRAWGFPSTTSADDAVATTPPDRADDTAGHPDGETR